CLPAIYHECARSNQSVGQVFWSRCRGKTLYESVSAAEARTARVGSPILTKVLVVVAIFAVLSLAISVGGRWIGRSIAMAGHTDDTTPRAVVISKELLAIPANMIRFEESRRDGEASKIDLYLRWPSMDGYSQDAR